MVASEEYEPTTSLAYSHNSKFSISNTAIADQIVCVTKANDSRRLCLVRAQDGVEIAMQETFLD